MKRTIVAVALGATLALTGTACGAPVETQDQNVEDCDQEDFENREAECGFADEEEDGDGGVFGKLKKKSSKYKSKIRVNTGGGSFGGTSKKRR